MRPVFRNYDQATLDREYNNRAKIPNVGDFLARYRQDSDALYQARRCQRDISYGPLAAQRLDVFTAVTPGPRMAPVQVFIHGGYWKSLSKEDFAFTAAATPEAVTVNLEYPLIPTVDMTTLVNACRQGLSWIYQNIQQYGGDPESIVVTGHSAGGHLAAMLLATPWAEVDSTLPANLVKGILAISGLYELTPIQLSFLNEELQLSDTDVRYHSPVHLLPPAGSQVHLVVGDQEGAEYNRQSQALAQAWDKHADIQVVNTPDHHFSIICPLAAADSPLSRHLQTLLEEAPHATGCQ